jgi:hypothetical protein
LPLAMAMAAEWQPVWLLLNPCRPRRSTKGI